MNSRSQDRCLLHDSCLLHDNDRCLLHDSGTLVTVGAPVTIALYLFHVALGVLVEDGQVRVHQRVGCIRRDRSFEFFLSFGRCTFGKILTGSTFSASTITMPVSTFTIDPVCRAWSSCRGRPGSSSPARSTGPPRSLFRALPVS